MAFMVALLIAVCAVAMGVFLSTGPEWVPRRRILVADLAILAMGLTAAATVGGILFVDASASGHDKVMGGYLALMAGGTAFLIVLTVGGMFRNFVLFSRSE